VYGVLNTYCVVCFKLFVLLQTTRDKDESNMEVVNKKRALLQTTRGKDESNMEVVNKKRALLQTTRGKDESNMEVVNKKWTLLQTTRDKDEPNMEVVKGGLISYLRYLYLFAHSCVQHILRGVFCFVFLHRVSCVWGVKHILCCVL
jgi:uncharacterized membrane protein